MAMEEAARRPGLEEKRLAVVDVVDVIDIVDVIVVVDTVDGVR